MGVTHLPHCPLPLRCCSQKRSQRVSKAAEQRIHVAQRAMGPCYYEVAQVYIGMCRADCLPKVGRSPLALAPPPQLSPHRVCGPCDQRHACVASSTPAPPPQAMHNLKQDLLLCRAFRSRCSQDQVPGARVTEAKTLFSMAMVHFQSGDLEQVRRGGWVSRVPCPPALCECQCLILVWLRMRWCGM